MRGTYPGPAPFNRMPRPTRHVGFTPHSPHRPPRANRAVWTGVIADIDIAEPASASNHALRDAVERQLIAGQSLGAQLIGAATDASVALVHAPITAVDEIRGGARLPAALTRAGRETRAGVIAAGERLRTAVGEDAGTRAPLPHAVVVGAAEVAQAVLRAQGTVTASAVDAVFALATAAARGDVQTTASRERYEVLAQADGVRAEG